MKILCVLSKSCTNAVRLQASSLAAWQIYNLAKYLGCPVCHPIGSSLLTQGHVQTEDQAPLLLPGDSPHHSPGADDSSDCGPPRPPLCHWGEQLQQWQVEFFWFSSRGFAGKDVLMVLMGIFILYAALSMSDICLLLLWSVCGQ